MGERRYAQDEYICEEMLEAGLDNLLSRDWNPTEKWSHDKFVAPLQTIALNLRNEPMTLLHFPTEVRTLFIEIFDHEIIIIIKIVTEVCSEPYAKSLFILKPCVSCVF